MSTRNALSVRDPKRGKLLAERLEVPRTFWGRGLGLSFRAQLPAGAGMWIRPCNGIHMLFMRFPLDVVFLDGESRVRRVHQGVRPWLGLIPYVPGANSVLELPAGTLDGLDLRPGDQLEFVGAS